MAGSWAENTVPYHLLQESEDESENGEKGSDIQHRSE